MSAHRSRGSAPAPFQLRRATPADAEALAQLRYAFRTEREPAVEAQAEFLERCREWMGRRLGPESSWRCWVANSGSRLVGTLWLQLIEKLPNPGDEPERHGYISSVYVAPPLRNAGIGSALLKAALELCEQEKVDSVFLWCTPRSRVLYERNGFGLGKDLLSRESGVGSRESGDASG